ncbi:hypothetical protein IH574_02465 [Candidatus Bathyarchaeota archaeon]|nr:hypothetical protein [Candidatus Bathyarchaeota archaeon]
MKTVDTIAFILIRDKKVLVERRRLDRVDALFLNKQSPYHEFNKIGETAYSQK